MNKIRLIFVAILLATGFLACSDEEGGDIYMVIKEVHFMAEGGITDLDPKVSGSLNVVADQEWINARVENGKIILEVPSFFSGVKRKGMIEISNKTSYKKVEITQFPHDLEVEGKREVATSLKSGGEYKFAVKTTFPNDVTRLRASFKDQADKNWIDAKFTSSSEFIVNVSANPTKKPKISTVYLVADGEVEATIMDSVIINSTYTAEDYVGKWTATFSNKEAKAFTEDIELTMNQSKKLVIKGLSVYEDSNVPVEIPITVGVNQFSIATGKTPLLKESDSRYIYISTTTDQFQMYGQGSGPQSFIGYISFDDNGKATCKFTPFDYYYGYYKMSGFALRAFNSNPPSSSGSFGVTRYMNLLELKMK